MADPFDIASLRINPSFAETAGVKKLLTTVPVRRPNGQEFFRIHPADDFRDTFAAINLKDDREFISCTRQSHRNWRARRST
jgi:hypothetical protein